MTNEILEQKWKEFFDDASRNYLEWETKVEVLKDDIGAQVLSQGLPLIGFMFEEKVTGAQNAIEIMLGEESGVHQTHVVLNPKKVFFQGSEEELSRMIEIEDETGAKTIIYLVQPISVLVEYEETEIMAQV